MVEGGWAFLEQLVCLGHTHCLWLSGPDYSPHRPRPKVGRVRVITQQ